MSTRILPRTGPRPLVPLGMVTGALGMLLLTRIGVDTRVRLARSAVAGADRDRVRADDRAVVRDRDANVPAGDSGVASAMVNTSQQIGGSIGTALLSTVAASAATPVDGYATAFAWAAGILFVGALVCGSLLRASTRPLLTHGPRGVEVPT